MANQGVHTISSSDDEGASVRRNIKKIQEVRNSVYSRFNYDSSLLFYSLVVKIWHNNFVRPYNRDHMQREPFEPYCIYANYLELTKSQVKWLMKRVLADGG